MTPRRPTTARPCRSVRRAYRNSRRHRPASRVFPPRARRRYSPRRTTRSTPSPAGRPPYRLAAEDRRQALAAIVRMRDRANFGEAPGRDHVRLAGDGPGGRIPQHQDRGVLQERPRTAQQRTHRAEPQAPPERRLVAHLHDLQAAVMTDFRRWLGTALRIMAVQAARHAHQAENAGARWRQRGNHELDIAPGIQQTQHSPDILLVPQARGAGIGGIRPHQAARRPIRAVDIHSPGSRFSMTP